MKLHNKKFISTKDFSKYLESNGWYANSIIPGIANIWRSNIRRNDEILQPINYNLLDFDVRVNDLIQVLSKVQQRSEDEIINEINNISSDIISIRVVHSDVSNGEIPFNDGVDLFNKAKELITSAARSLKTPQKNKYSGKNPEPVNNFLNSLKLAQTEVGSYVLNVIAPIYLEDHEQQDHCRVPFSRSVSERIINSISKLDEAVQSFKDTNDYKYFELAVNDGVGSSLCSALIGLSGTNKNRSVEITIKPSPFADRRNLKSTSVYIAANNITIIEEANNYFLDDYAIENYELKGYVVELKRQPNSTLGTITVAEKQSSEKPKNIKVELNEKNYDEAIKSHIAQGTLVSISGKLIVTKKRKYLTSITSFEITNTNS